MNDQLQAIIRRHCQPRVPQPTDIKPRLRFLPGIKAVLFDVYGTLLQSSSGDIGTTAISRRGNSFVESLKELQIDFHGSGSQGVERLVETIRNRHAEMKAAGIDFPEVDIVNIWKQVLDSLFRDKLTSRLVVEEESLMLLALEYEVRTNPVWPMPNLIESLEKLYQSGMRLGLISNAQFFTPQMFGALMEQDLDQLGFHSDLKIYSYRYGHAKPGSYLYKLAVVALKNMGISPAEVVYVGNDMLKDIHPAAEIGFQTALFAGDARSLRLWDDELTEGVLQPNLVLTDLAQLLGCVVGTP